MVNAKTLKRLLGILVALLALAQLIRPERTNPPVDPTLTLDASAAPPAAIAGLLERGCRDCHSHETV